MYFSGERKDPVALLGSTTRRFQSYKGLKRGVKRIIRDAVGDYLLFRCVSDLHLKSVIAENGKGR